LMPDRLGDWVQAAPLLAAGYHLDVLAAVAARREQEAVYPAEERVFYALERTPFAAVQVIIVGQDPYHGAGQADGLAFSVPEGVAAPPRQRARPGDSPLPATAPPAPNPPNGQASTAPPFSACGSRLAAGSALS